jgi:hypothetical protein
MHSENTTSVTDHCFHFQEAELVESVGPHIQGVLAFHKYFLQSVVESCGSFDMLCVFVSFIYVDVGADSGF